MKTWRIAIVTSFCLLILLALAYVIYEKNAQLREYKRTIFGMREDYSLLKQDYQRYQQKTRNLRQIIITANNQGSKNIILGNIVYSHAKNIDGDISIYYKNLVTNESIIVDGEKQYYMASLYKVILAIYLLEEIRRGTVTLDTPVETNATLATALDKIITESNNEFAQLLAERFGWQKIESAMKTKLGIDFSFNKDLQTNVVNMGKLFEEITASLNINDSDSKYLLRLLRHQQNTAKLPKYLPQNILSHNKTGELDEYSHDAGIFYTPKANYVLVFMSKTNSPANTNEQMALLSKEIYDTLNQN